MPRTAPSHSASAIYSEGDTIYIQLPATKGYTTELSFPATPNGLAALLRLLRQREMTCANTPQHIASPSMPIQHVVNNWIKEGPKGPGKKAESKQAPQPSPDIQDLSFFLSDLFE